MSAGRQGRRFQAAAAADRWCRILDQLYGGRHRMDVGHDGESGGKALWYECGTSRLIDIEAPGGALLRAGTRADPDRVLVLTQLEGACILRHAGGTTRLEQGGICLLPAEADVHYRYPVPYRQLALCCEGRVLEEWLPGWRRHTFLAVSGLQGAGVLFYSLLRTLRHEMDALPSDCHDKALHALMKLLAAAMEGAGRRRVAASGRLAALHKERVRRFVLEHLAEPDLSIQRISAALGLSPRYLHHLFSREDMHLMQWVWAQRLERCRQELTQSAMTGRSISTIAFAWGFNDPAHFSRAFRRRYGVTPREMQRRAAAGAAAQALVS